MLPKDYQWILDGTEKIQPGDLMRVRENEHSDYGLWQSADHLAGKLVGYFPAWHFSDLQFCRPTRPAVRPAHEPEWEPLPIEDDTMTVPGRDQARYRQPGAEWPEWQDTHGEPALLTAYMQQKPPEMEWEWRRRKVTKTKSRTPTSDRGSKYHRTITQTLPGDTQGLSVTVDVYDVLKAFSVTCPATQHAIKKLLCPGQRGSKSAVQDLREAIGSIERSIQLLGDER